MIASFSAYAIARLNGFAEEKGIDHFI
jgi:hypothetical protein